MKILVLAFLGGIVFVQQRAALPDLRLLYAPCGAALVIGLLSPVLIAHRDLSRHLRRVLLAISAFLAGILWSVNQAGQQLSHRLPESLAGKTLVLSGCIEGLVQRKSRSSRFVFAVETIRLPEGVEYPRGAGAANLPEKVRLNWYHRKDRPPPALKAGQCWRLPVRLKPPHGFANPGGFDYERWLFSQALDATGYVYQRQPSGADSVHRLPGTSWRGAFDRLRQTIGEAIDRAFSGEGHDRLARYAGMVTALATGDRQGISSSQWQTLLQTGTNHLVAISGLHIGLAYLLGYLPGRWGLAVLLYRVKWFRRFTSIPMQHIGMLCGFALALFYALLAGLSIPTQRALVMLSILVLVAFCRRQSTSLDILALALAVLLVWQPLSVLSAGFWFSFMAVGVIFYVLKTDRDGVADESAHNGRPRGWRRGWKALRLWLKVQFFITLSLLPLSLLMFQQASLIAPFSNTLMVPYVSFLVVPVVLGGLAMFFLIPSLSLLLFKLAAWLLAAVWPLLSMLGALPFSRLTVGNVHPGQVLVSSILIYLMLYPPWQGVRQGAGKWLYRTACLSIFFGALLLPTALQRSQLPEGEFEVTVLDVGQGLAVLVQTRNHTLVFDAGPRLGETNDAGKTVVVPYLRKVAGDRLDRLIISHADQDHIGGAASIMAAYPQSVLTGQGLESLSRYRPETCSSKLSWRWDKVDFNILHPGPETPASVTNTQARKRTLRNNHSCVLLISSPAGRVLLTGDIEKQAEQQLLNHPLPDSVDMMTVPHHGSKTSSGRDFIKRLSPVYAVITTGYRNRYRLPATEIVDRYRRQGSQVLITSQTGAIRFHFRNKHKQPAIHCYRQAQRRYWFHRTENDEKKSCS